MKETQHCKDESAAVDERRWKKNRLPTRKDVYDADKSVDQEVVVCVGRILQTHTVWGYHGRGIDRKKSRERLLENCVFGFDSAATTSTVCVINTNYSSEVATRVQNNTRFATK